MRQWIKVWIVALLLLAGCGEEKCREEGVGDGKAWQEVKVAVFLPMENGLDVHWRRTLDLAADNLRKAFRDQPSGVRLAYEWYDESVADLPALAKELAAREDITAAVGGLYSSAAQEIAWQFSRAEKPFFTLSTSEEFVRAFSKSGCLWAMTETDITQCEVLLSKALFYGAESVALLVKEEDVYGQTFTDWFAFQASELSMEVKGIFPYTEGDLAGASWQAHAAGADVLICVPSEMEDIGVMLSEAQRYMEENGATSRMLFTDTGYGADCLKLFGEQVEGMEGVTFGADPQSGFEVGYEMMFGEQATLGEAQLYDAAMLLGYGVYYTLLHPEADLKEALRKVVDGRGKRLSGWTEEGMRLAVNAFANGEMPDIAGASGQLDFDNKVYTNVLGTTYYHYKVYDGRYILLDYNTSDGSKRTDATLAGWNRKTEQMQDFEDTEMGIVYPALEEKWALLVAASSTWTNYRHQADVFAMYRLLKQNGYTDDRIVLIAEDDLTHSPRNPNPGVLQVRPGGENVREGAVIDYHTSDLRPEDIGEILNGRRSERLPEVVGAGEKDNVLVFWSGHGLPGELCWLEEEQGFTAELARAVFEERCGKNRCRKLMCLVETCYSGSVFEGCLGLPGALFITAANPHETSKADIFSTDLGVWMSNRFTATLQDQLEANPAVPLRELYYRLFINTVGSHVMVYNVPFYGNIYKNTFEEFL